MHTSHISNPAGRSVVEWAKAAGISRASFYLLDPEQRPEFVKIGRRTIVTEDPAAWLTRIRAAGGARLRKAGRA